MASTALLSGVGAATGVGCVMGSLCGLKMYADSLVNGRNGRSKRRDRRSKAARHEESDSSSTEDMVPVKPRSGRRKSLELAKQEVAKPIHHEPMEAGWQGFSMEEARRFADMNQEAVAELTPQEVLGNLQKGNMRFWTGAATRPEKSAFERRALISKQFPLVAVLSCSDSRVPTEIVFDVGLGDMFVIRVAGNCLDTASLASLQYAVKYLKVKVVIVMGHEGCGAVKAAGLPSGDIAKEPQALGRLLNNLKGGLEHTRLQNIQDARSYDREAVVTNVKRQVEQLAQDDTVVAKISDNELLCVGAFYEISSGIVDFFSELNVEDAEKGAPITRGVSSRLVMPQKK